MSNNTIDVEQDDYKFADFPQRLFTHGVATCIAIAFLNRTNRSAGLLHAPNLSHEEQMLREFLKQAGSRSSDEIKFFVTGGNANDEDCADAVLADREYVRDAISRIQPNAEISYEWLENAPSCSVLVTTDPPDCHINLED